MGAVTAKAAKLLEVGYLDSHSSPVFVTQILSTEGVANGDCAGGVVLPDVDHSRSGMTSWSSHKPTT
jgi:hypothetical protein